MDEVGAYTGEIMVVEAIEGEVLAGVGEGEEGAEGEDDNQQQSRSSRYGGCSPTFHALSSRPGRFKALGRYNSNGIQPKIENDSMLRIGVILVTLSNLL